ncbi:MAG: VOC family protein [Acidimicrobiia bacterium]
MTTPAVRIHDITIDCSDPQQLARFWADILGRPVEGAKGPYVWLQRTEDAPGVGFQKVSEPKVGKNRIHLDVAVPDVVRAKSQIEALGGWRVDGYEAGGFLVMADPEGNEFCVIPAAPFRFDKQGRADYLDHLEI